MSESASLDWKVVEGVLPAGWRQMAADRKLVRPNLPKHMGTVVTDIGQILRLVLYQVGRNVGLQTAAAAFAAAGLLAISSVALHKWMKKLGPYLAELVCAMVNEAHGVFAAERWAGYEIVAVDATCVQRPGATGTTARVHRALRLVDLRVMKAVVTDHTGGETFRRFFPEAGQLWLGDRGYANPPGVAWVKGHSAEVLVRYNRGSLPLYDAGGFEIDVLNKLAKLRKPERSRQWQAFVHAAEGERIEGRLCAVRLPVDKAEQARERLRREHGTALTQESLAMADFVVLFTTAPSSKLTLEQVLELYRMRWQIELDFKRDKSLTGLDRLPNFLPNTIESWICAKLLLHQILRRLAEQEAAIPPSAAQLADAICPDYGKRAA